jgi:hypothetical protein
MQSYASRLEEMKTRFGYAFGKFKRKKLIFGHHEGEYEETDKMVEKLLGRSVATFVELGVNWGASLFMLARFLSEKATVVGVDAGLFPGIHDVPAVIEALKQEGHKVTFLHDTTQNMISTVKDFGPIDLLHIDADHSFAGAKHDWENYVPMVRKGGIVLFHDISYIKGARKFWLQQKPKLETFYEITSGDRGMAVVVKTW